MKNCTPLWREAHSKPRVSRTEGLGPLFEVEMLKKCTALCREAHFQVKMLNTQHVRTTFGRSDAVLRGRRKVVHIVKSEPSVRVIVAVSTALPGVGHVKRTCKDAFSVAGAVQET